MSALFFEHLKHWLKSRYFSESTNYKRFIRVFECCSFNSILDYRKIIKILPKYILFLQNMILNRAIRSILYSKAKKINE